MTELQQILERIRQTSNCDVDPPRGQPILRDGDRLPDDLAEFYRCCGGVSLFAHSIYPFRIVGPDEPVRSNPDIAQAEHPDEISDTWYIVARGGNEEAITGTL